MSATQSLGVTLGIYLIWVWQDISILFIIFNFRQANLGHAWISASRDFLDVWKRVRSHHVSTSPADAKTAIYCCCTIISERGWMCLTWWFLACCKAVLTVWQGTGSNYVSSAFLSLFVTTPVKREALCDFWVQSERSQFNNNKGRTTQSTRNYVHVQHIYVSKHKKADLISAAGHFSAAQGPQNVARPAIDFNS